MRNFKKFLALVLAVIMMAGGLVYTVSAAEYAVTGTYDSVIEYLNILGVYKGYGNGDMGANDSITRMQMAIFFTRIKTGQTDDATWNTPTSTNFTDVTQFGAAIDFAAGNGIVKGYGDGLFGPDDGITYQDALVMAVRALGYETATMSYPWGYAMAAMDIGLTAGLSGVGYNEILTRGQVAQVIYNVLNTPLKSTNTTLLQTRFNVVTNQMVLVATNSYGTTGLTNTDKVVKTGYVALKLINNDGTLGSTVFVKESVVSAALPSGMSLYSAIGYSFTVIGANSYSQVLSVKINNFEAYTNLGSQSGIKLSGENITVGGVTYDLISYTTAANQNFNTNFVSLYTSVYNYSSASSVLSDVGSDAAALGIAGNTYGKLVMIDDGNDGTYDRAIYRPYAFAKYVVESFKNDNVDGDPATNYTMLYFDNNNTVQSFFIDTFGLTFNYVGTNGTYTQAATRSNTLVKEDGSKTSGITLAGLAVANGNYIVFDYDNYTNTLTVIQNLGSLVTGTLTSNNGAGAASVVIDGATYSFGFKVASDNSPILGVDGAPFYKAYSDANSALTTIVSDAQVGKQNCSYLTYNGKIIYIEKYTPSSGGGSDPATTYSEYKIIDITKCKDSSNNYNLAVDSYGNITVKAFNTANGAWEDIKVNSINGAQYGVLRNTYGAMTINIGFGSIDLANLNTVFDDAYLYMVTGTVNGGYALTTLLDWNKLMDAGDATNGGTYAALNDKVSFYYGFSTSEFAKVTLGTGSDITSSRISAGAATVVVAIGSDGVFTNVGKPINGAWLYVNDVNTTVLAASNSRIILYTPSKTVAEIAGGFTAAPSQPTPTNDASDYYLFVKDAVSNKVEIIDVNGTKMYKHTFSGALNLKSWATGSIVLVTNSSVAPIITIGGIYKINADGTYASKTWADFAGAMAYMTGTLNAIGDTHTIKITGATANDTNINAAVGEGAVAGYTLYVIKDDNTATSITSTTAPGTYTGKAIYYTINSNGQVTAFIDLG